MIPLECTIEYLAPPTPKQRRALLAIARRMEFESSPVVDEVTLRMESAFDEATFGRVIAELQAGEWIRCAAGVVRLGLRVIQALPTRSRVLHLHCGAEAQPFRESPKWFVTERAGGSIIGIGVGEDAAWQDAWRNELNRLIRAEVWGFARIEKSPDSPAAGSQGGVSDDSVTGCTPETRLEPSSAESNA